MHKRFAWIFSLLGLPILLGCGPRKVVLSLERPLPELSHQVVLEERKIQVTPTRAFELYYLVKNYDNDPQDFIAFLGILQETRVRCYFSVANDKFPFWICPPYAGWTPFSSMVVANVTSEGFILTALGNKEREVIKKHLKLTPQELSAFIVDKRIGQTFLQFSPDANLPAFSSFLIELLAAKSTTQLFVTNLIPPRWYFD